MHIFLSYSRADTPIAEAIAATLKQAGHKVFFDQYRIKAAEDFNRIIWGEIQKTDLFIFLISPNSIQSGSYALTELGFAEKKWPNPERRVLPVVVEQTELKEVPVYASICHILRPEGNAAAEVRAEVSRLHRRHRWVQIGRAAAVFAVVVVMSLAGVWGYQEYLAQQPTKARSELAAMGIQYDENSFVDSSYQGDLIAVDLFLTAGMDPNVGSTNELTYTYEGGSISLSRGTTALMYAIIGGQMHVAERLLEVGTDVNSKNDEGNTALMMAMATSQMQMVERLLKAGADVKSKDEEGNTALYWAAVGGHDELVRTMLEPDAPTEIVDKIFKAAVYWDKDGHIAILRLLLYESFAVSTATIDRAFIDAAYQNDFKKLELLVEKVSDKPRIASEALIKAYTRPWSEAKAELVRRLFAMGADVNAQDDDGVTPLLAATFNRQIDEKKAELVLTLLENGANPDSRCRCTGMGGGGWTPLTYATWNIKPEIISLLLEHGADVNIARAASNDISTPLIIAVNRYRKKVNMKVNIIKVLLEKGAKVNDAVGDGWTALFEAARLGYKEAVTVLLENDADIHFGHNPLLGTVNKDRFIWAETQQAAKLLLEAGADINKPSKKDGQTVLMRAVQTGNPDMVRFFLTAGAHVAGKDAEGRTAEVFAKRGGNKEIIELLHRTLD